MRILALPKYGRLGASSRLRTFQYLSYWERAGFDVRVSPLFNDEYIRALYARRLVLASAIKGYFLRAIALISSGNFDLIFLEKEALPWLPSVVEFALLRSSARLVIDYDDAIFHQYDKHQSLFVRKILGHKLDRLMGRANLITVGNRYLGARAESAGGRRVEWVPTVVDLERYSPIPLFKSNGNQVTIGWIGSPSTASYLTQITPALQILAKRYPIRCLSIGARSDQLIGTPFQAVPWSEESEVEALQQLDIGIMPLPDEPWERGKCGYKLIQYMACGIPVVASPVGANREIVTNGENGLFANDMGAWVDSLARLIEDKALRIEMGNLGRKRVESTYSLQVHGPRLSDILRGVC